MGRILAEHRPSRIDSDRTTWSAQPVSGAAFGSLLLLLVASPLMRGGNRHVALMVLEAIALAFLAFIAASTHWNGKLARREWILAFVLLSPLWLTIVYLMPVLPASVWNALPGRSVYVDLMTKSGIARDAWLPLSLVPDATLVSTLSGSLLIAGFAGGYLASARQLRNALVVFVAVAFVQIVFGLLQASGGQNSSLYFGALGGRPFGTFANPNHFANYLGMALVAYVLLAWQTLSTPRKWRDAAEHSSRAGLLALWLGGTIFLIVGIFMSRSRAGMLTALGATAAAVILVLVRGSRSKRKSWRSTTLLAAVVVAAGLALVGADLLLVRFDLERLERDVLLRALQAKTTYEGAAAFWPWGSGWGTYYAVYPRFQPSNLVGIADYAHHDYAQMLFEGGIFALALMLAFAYLLVSRALELARAAIHNSKLTRDEMTSAICGIALLGFLGHSLREFNMHIPANAIIASLLAGAFLRPLNVIPRDPQSEGIPHD